MTLTDQQQAHASLTDRDGGGPRMRQRSLTGIIDTVENDAYEYDFFGRTDEFPDWRVFVADVNMEYGQDFLPDDPPARIYVRVCICNNRPGQGVDFDYHFERYTNPGRGRFEVWMLTAGGTMEVV